MYTVSPRAVQCGWNPCDHVKCTSGWYIISPLSRLTVSLHVVITIECDLKLKFAVLNMEFSRAVYHPLSLQSLELSGSRILHRISKYGFRRRGRIARFHSTHDSGLSLVLRTSRRVIWLLSFFDGCRRRKSASGIGAIGS